MDLWIKNFVLGSLFERLIDFSNLNGLIIGLTNKRIMNLQKPSPIVGLRFVHVKQRFISKFVPQLMSKKMLTLNRK